MSAKIKTFVNSQSYTLDELINNFLTEKNLERDQITALPSFVLDRSTASGYYFAITIIYDEK